MGTKNLMKWCVVLTRHESLANLANLAGGASVYLEQ